MTKQEFLMKMESVRYVELVYNCNTPKKPDGYRDNRYGYKLVSIFTSDDAELNYRNAVECAKVAMDEEDRVIKCREFTPHKELNPEDYTVHGIRIPAMADGDSEKYDLRITSICYMKHRRKDPYYSVDGHIANALVFDDSHLSFGKIKIKLTDTDVSVSCYRTKVEATFKLEVMDFDDFIKTIYNYQPNIVTDRNEIVSGYRN